MSRRTSIINAIVEKLRTIDGTGSFKTNIYGAAYGKLKFWDEIQQFPAIYLVAGTETREYHPSDFTWGYLNISLKVYCKGPDSGDELESLLEDVELVLHDNRNLVYDPVTLDHTTEILITAIVTDEGLLAPYSIAELNLQVRYQVSH
jgi:hypothetical protein